MKKLLYLFLAGLIIGCSNSKTSNTNTLYLENNGLTLSFDENGFRVENESGEYIALNPKGVEIYGPRIYNRLDVLNSDGSKYLATIVEEEYKNNRGKGGEMRLFSNFEGEYSGLQVASNIEKLFNSRSKKSNHSSSRQNTLGKACVECGGTGLRRNPTSLNSNKLENCRNCNGTGRIFN